MLIDKILNIRVIKHKLSSAGHITLLFRYYTGYLFDITYFTTVNCMPRNTQNEATNTETLVYFISCIIVSKSVYCNTSTISPVVAPFYVLSVYSVELPNATSTSPSDSSSR